MTSLHSFDALMMSVADNTVPHSGHFPDVFPVRSYPQTPQCPGGGRRLRRQRTMVATSPVSARGHSGAATALGKYQPAIEAPAPSIISPLGYVASQRHT